MKINCGRNIETKFKIKEKWHPWFAWFPVRIGPRDCRWLEVVMRKGKYTVGETGYLNSPWKYKYKERINAAKVYH